MKTYNSSRSAGYWIKTAAASLIALALMPASSIAQNFAADDILLVDEKSAPASGYIYFYNSLSISDSSAIDEWFDLPYESGTPINIIDEYSLPIAISDFEYYVSPTVIADDNEAFASAPQSDYTPIPTMDVTLNFSAESFDSPAAVPDCNPTIVLLGLPVLAMLLWRQARPRFMAVR